MVFHGRSRGCASCRKRRKNVGSTPMAACSLESLQGLELSATKLGQCIKAKRACIGYEEPVSWAFQQYDDPRNSSPPPFQSRARKCTLPPRTLVPGTQVLIVDVDNTNSEISEEQLLDYAARAFYYDFCVLPSVGGGSRGFLSNLERVANGLGPSSMLRKACQAVSYITHGQAQCRPQLIKNAEAVYHELAGSLAAAIERSAPKITTESKLVAMLLGIYEISASNGLVQGSHAIHAKGLGTLLGTGDSPLSLLNRLSSGCLIDQGTSSKSSKVHNLFSMPQAVHQPISLDNLIVHLDTLWARYKVAYHTEDFQLLKTSGEALQARFTTWNECQAPEARPTTLTTLSGGDGSLDFSPGCWPGRIDTYSDCHIAGIWNIARAAQLLLSTLIMRLGEDLADNSAVSDNMNAIDTIVEEIIASVPYHLTENIYDFLNGTSTQIDKPGRTIGGLLIMHPLYVASRMPSISTGTRDYLQRCLAWISSNMGIGHASKLAQSEDMVEENVRSACMIIWTGFLE